MYSELFFMLFGSFITLFSITYTKSGLFRYVVKNPSVFFKLLMLTFERDNDKKQERILFLLKPVLNEPEVMNDIHNYIFKRYGLKNIVNKGENEEQDSETIDSKRVQPKQMKGLRRRNRGDTWDTQNGGGREVNVLQSMLDNPDMIKSVMNDPHVKSLVSNPDIMNMMNNMMKNH